jgi:hypothetical protein
MSMLPLYIFLLLYKHMLQAHEKYIKVTVLYIRSTELLQPFVCTDTKSKLFLYSLTVHSEGENDIEKPQE